MSGVKRWDHAVRWEGMKIAASYMAIKSGGKYVLASDYERDTQALKAERGVELIERERANAECFRQIATDLVMKVMLLTAPGEELRKASADALERINAKLASLRGPAHDE